MQPGAEAGSAGSYAAPAVAAEGEGGAAGEADPAPVQPTAEAADPPAEEQAIEPQCEVDVALDDSPVAGASPPPPGVDPAPEPPAETPPPAAPPGERSTDSSDTEVPAQRGSRSPSARPLLQQGGGGDHGGDPFAAARDAVAPAPAAPPAEVAPPAPASAPAPAPAPAPVPAAPAPAPAPPPPQPAGAASADPFAAPRPAAGAAPAGAGARRASAHSDPAGGSAASGSFGSAPQQPQRVVFKVHDPQMTTSGKTVELAFWTYMVEARTGLPEWKNSRTRCVRRYSDFARLRLCLLAELPGAIVPPLPEKDLQGTVEKFVQLDDGFLEYRQRALGRFLNACGQHELLRSAQALRRFADGSHDGQGSDSWAEWSKRALHDAVPSGAAPDDSMASKAASAVVSRWKRLTQKRETMDAAVLGCPEGNCDCSPRPRTGPRWEDLLGALDAQQQAVQHARAALQHQMQDRCALATAFGEAGQVLTLLGDVETGQPMLRQDLYNIGKYARQLGQLQAGHSQREGTRVLDSLAYWSNTFGGLKENLAQLRDMEGALHRRQQAAKDLTDQRDKARGRGESGKAAGMEGDLAAAKEKIVEQQRHCDAARKRFREEWAAFWQAKREEWKQLMHTLVQLRATAAREEQNLQFEPVIDCW